MRYAGIANESVKQDPEKGFLKPHERLIPLRYYQEKQSGKSYNKVGPARIEIFDQF